MITDHAHYNHDELAFTGFAVLAFLPVVALASPCEGLLSLTIPNTTIVSATVIAPLTSEPRPSYCRVTAVSKPVPDSEIRLEVWMPGAEKWNGKFVGTGNGGYSGQISYAVMQEALQQGYATAGSNTGHEGGDLKFGVDHPEKINDWAYRAVHVMTETAKLLLHSYYGHFAAHSYFSGCSTGGQQALTEAQSFPADYDGILAGDPGNDRIHLNVGFLWSWLALNKDPASRLPVSKLPLLHRAVIAACDNIDGIKDGLIDDPRRCAFDPGSLLCVSSDNETCLTAGQVEAVRTIYGGAYNPRTGEPIFPGWARGSEATGDNPAGGWSGYFVGQAEPARIDFWRYWVFHDPNWNPRSFDFDRDVAYADSQVAVVTANNPDLSPFRARGGKLLMYHGWADPVVPPEDSIRYYESVRHTMGGAENTAKFFRLFLAPGMGHCSGGPGPNTFEGLHVLDRWVAEGIAPDRIVASHRTKGAVDRTRPLCPYPLVARWKGSGSQDDAASFSCAASVMLSDESNKSSTKSDKQ